VVDNIPGKTHRRKRDARKRAVSLHRERVTTKLARRAWLKSQIKTLERMEDREWTEKTHSELIYAKSRLRAVEQQLRAFGDVDII
jgi:hypothetical protein